jgi:predicted nucleotidyltransferase
VGRQEIFDKLAANREELNRRRVRALFVFGSFARNEASADSDVDILVEFSSPIGMFEFVRLQKHLEEILGRKVDLVTKDALRAQLREQILREAVRAA